MNNTANTETAMSQYKLLGVSKQTGATIYKHPEGHIIAIKKDSYGTKWEHHSADRSMSTGSYSGFKDLTDHVNKFHEAKQ